MLFGVNTQAETTICQLSITANQFDVIGSFIFVNELFPTVTKVLESGSLPLEKLITHLLPLDRINEGIRLLRAGDALKVIILP